jgi:DNA-binding NarL/FixJ family response regulator
VGDSAPSACAALTDREERLVRILASGATNREIASRLGLREQTVKNRLSAIYGKLGLRNRLELAVYLGRMAASETTRREF